MRRVPHDGTTLVSPTPLRRPAAQHGSSTLAAAAIAPPATWVELASPGPWHPGSGRPALVGVVREGLIIREVAVGRATSAELLGPGDVLLLPPANDHLLPASATRWSVVDRASISWLVGTLDAVVRTSPRLAGDLLSRAQRRIDHLAFCQSVAQLIRVDDRVLAMLWHLAERWGRVTPDGVVVALPLTHRALAALVGARRPSVTTAIGGLSRKGALERRDDRSWMLLGEPPDWWRT
jgi:CRP/FNR family transcriptional regulator, cyclic AMP receptor protein